MSKNILFAFLFLMGAIPSIAQKNYQVQSPNRDIKVEVTVADKVTFAIVQDHSEVMNSTVSMTLQGGEVLGANPKVLKVTKTSVDKEIPSPFYKKDVVKDIYNEMQISFRGNYGLVLGCITMESLTVSRRKERNRSLSPTRRPSITSPRIIRHSPLT